MTGRKRHPLKGKREYLKEERRELDVILKNRLLTPEGAMAFTLGFEYGWNAAKRATNAKRMRGSGG